MKRLPLLLALLALGLLPSGAQAQYSDMWDGYEPSREWFALSFGVGPYQPSVGNDSFRQIFGNDRGPYITGGIDFRIFRLGDFAAFLGSVHMGAARYSGRACDFAGGVLNCENRVDETSLLRIFPLSTTVGLTIDALSRKLNIPFNFTGRIGLDSVFYGTKTGGERDAAGTSLGLRWEAEVHLELDFLERRAQRKLDEEWGINHSYLYFRIFGSTASSKLPVGTAFAWAGGLGFVF